MDTEWFKARKKALKVGDQKIADAIGRDRTTVTKIINGGIRFDPAFVDGMASVLEVSRNELLERVGILNGPVAEEQRSNATVLALEGGSMEKPQGNLPVYGTALAAAKEVDGEALEQTTLNKSEIVEYVKRPLLLNGRTDAYALHVQGSSMHPALPDGEMLAVAPNMPLAIGDNVVVYLRPADPDEDDGVTARAVLVKELVRRTAGYVILRQ